MAKKPNNVKIIGRFIERYLGRLEGKPDMSRIVMNLISDDITDIERIRNFVLIEEYYKLLRENNGISYLTLIQLADKFDMGERQIQNIIYKWTEKYKRNSNVSAASSSL